MVNYLKRMRRTRNRILIGTGILVCLVLIADSDIDPTEAPETPSMRLAYPVSVLDHEALPNGMTRVVFTDGMTYTLPKCARPDQWGCVNTRTVRMYGRTIDLGGTR